MGKQKVVVKLSMDDEKKRCKALKTAVALPGVISVTLEGTDKDRILVVGEGIDSIVLTKMLRKRMGYAELLSVSSADEKKEEKEKSNTGGEAKSIQPVVLPNHYVVQPYGPYRHEMVEANYDPSCYIM